MTISAKDLQVADYPLILKSPSESKNTHNIHLANFILNIYWSIAAL